MFVCAVEQEMGVGVGQGKGMWLWNEIGMERLSCVCNEVNYRNRPNVMLATYLC